MTIGITACAFIALVILFFRGGGGRISLALSALSGAAIGGVIAVLATAVFGGVLALGSAILSALP